MKVDAATLKYLRGGKTPQGEIAEKALKVEKKRRRKVKQ